METLISQLLMRNRLCSSAQVILHNSLIIRVFHFTAKKAEALKTEAIRILLKHPYERRPDRCSADTDLSELWDDDPLQVALLNGIIDSIKDWSTAVIKAIEEEYDFTPFVYKEVK